jgi:hypothetical protein
MMMGAVHGQRGVFACRHRKGYNLWADFPVACISKHLEAAYGKH